MTDEAAFEVLPEFNGIGFSVGREIQGIAGMFETPSDVRRWIAEMVRPQAPRREGSDEHRARKRRHRGRAAEPRSRGRRQWPHGRAGQSDRTRSCGGASRVSTAIRCSRRLLAGDDEKGFTDVVLDGLVCVTVRIHPQHRARHHGAHRSNGDSVRITDFAPRFEQFGRTFRPPQLMRIIEPVAGLPRITIRFRPTSGYGQADMQRAFGSNHIRYTGGETIRLTTDAPLAYIDRESPFVLSRPIAMVFGADTPFEGDLTSTCREFCDRTRDVLAGMDQPARHLLRMAGRGDPRRDHAEAVRASRRPARSSPRIRPRFPKPRARGAPGTTASAGCVTPISWCASLSRIGASRTMENYISYILTIVTGQTGRAAAGLQHRVDRSAGRAHRHRPEGLSRRRAGAHRQRGGGAEPARHLWQRDPRGGADVLRPAAAAHGRREPVPPARAAWREGRGSSRSSPTPASGNTASAGASTRIRPRCAGPAASGWRRSRRISASTTAPPIGPRARSRSSIRYSRRRGTRSAARSRPRSDRTTSTPACCCCPSSVPSRRAIRDLSLLSTRSSANLSAIRTLCVTASADDFGLPETAFLICRFWLIDALWAIGRKEDARDMFIDALKLRNSYGLMSEDVHPVTKELWGNFPQTYSMAGIILSAIRLSRSWEDRYWRGSS